MFCIKEEAQKVPTRAACCTTRRSQIKKKSLQVSITTSTDALEDVQSGLVSDIVIM